MGRKEGVQLLKSWYLSSAAARPGRGGKGAHSAAGSASGVVLRGAGAPSNEPSPMSPTQQQQLAATGSGDAARWAEEDERMWKDDVAFLAWVEHASGAARVAMELRVSVPLTRPLPPCLPLPHGCPNPFPFLHPMLGKCKLLYLPPSSAPSFA